MQVTFEFVGGPHDGRVVNGRLGEGDEAERHYLFTQHGTVGFPFKVASDYAVETLAREKLQVNRRHNFQQHYYAVTDRIEDGGETHVWAEYVPEATQVHRKPSH